MHSALNHSKQLGGMLMRGKVVAGDGLSSL